MYRFKQAGSAASMGHHLVAGNCVGTWPTTVNDTSVKEEEKESTTTPRGGHAIFSMFTLTKDDKYAMFDLRHNHSEKGGQRNKQMTIITSSQKPINVTDIQQKFSRHMPAPGMTSVQREQFYSDEHDRKAVNTQY
ncbi:hypothetical protein BaRGS_00016988 [Batillaria attramentaria]|uniref:Uncharacterized protein n=1 Tax=Batillaria attramentaria TaxID=370345 RepID=A0ABD0KWY4_9CAEN